MYKLYVQFILAHLGLVELFDFLLFVIIVKSNLQ